MADQEGSYDVLIVGQGAAAFSAGLYAARYQMRTVIFGDKFGGETAIGGTIENYPGYKAIDGFELMANMKEQVEQYGVEIVDEGVEKITREAECFEARTEGDVYRGNSVILAVGRERRKLHLPHEDEWTGKGVSFCSTCDAPLYRGKVAAVVGGGNAAVEGAVLLGKYADKVYIIYRGERFVRPEPIGIQRLKESANVEALLQTNVVELKGDDGLTGVVLDQSFNGGIELTLDGLFIEIGADPRSGQAQELGAELNGQGEVMVDKTMRTRVPGLLAAGDLTDASGNLKQTITAAAQGALAATSAYEYVAAHPRACQPHAIGYRLD